MERLADARASAGSVFFGHPDAKSSDEFVTPPPKASVLPDEADTQLYDVMQEPLAPSTPDFKKPARVPSTTSVDTKRWVYQHPGVPKPQPRALLQEPLPVPDQTDDNVKATTDDQGQEAEPMDCDAEQMNEDAAQMDEDAKQMDEDAAQMDEDATAGPPSKVFGRRDQLGLRTSIKAKAKSKKAAATEDAEEDAVSAKHGAKKLKRKVSKSRLGRLRKLRRSRSSLEGDKPREEADDKEPEHEAENEGEDDRDEWNQEPAEPKAHRKPKAKATPKGKSAPKAKATPKGKSAPKAKATPKSKSAAKAKATPAKSSSSKPAEGDEDALTKSRGGRPKGAKNKAKEPAKADNKQKKKRAPRVNPSIRLNSKTADDTPHDPLDLKYMLEFWSDFEDPNADIDILKKEVRAWKPVFTYVSPDVYWTRKESALTFHYETEDGEACKNNVGHFHFSNNKCGLLVAIACTYLLAACH
ncbi:unnamed protein product [Symbiodinium necroappetens]|uniref:Uncharacterized protein n=1 Tax=Symbiodinium necroappetens TaxID=1628268 RepID=A0A813CAY0_9DINO|nr:unnamed protein product [Symbiodinium necroappetens]